MPNSASSAWLTSPARPSSRISPSPTTNGGVMIGSSASAFNGLARRRGPRSANSAIKVPISVVPVAVINARNSVFQATPQRTPPARQARPQTRSWPSRSAKAPADHWPASSSNAPTSALATGSATNRASKVLHSSTAQATNRSPLNAPNRARPAPSSINSDTSTTAPPMPMPGWPLAKGPNSLASVANDQPCAPMAKPATSRPASAPPAPSDSSQPCSPAAGSRQARVPASRPAAPRPSQGRP